RRMRSWPTWRAPTPAWPWTWKSSLSCEARRSPGAGSKDDPPMPLAWDGIRGSATPSLPETSATLFWPSKANPFERNPAVDINLKSLIGKLNDVSRRSLESAAGLCLSRTNYNVEVEHWLLKLLEMNDTDLARILRHYEVDTSRLTRELTRAIDALKTGNSRPPALSPMIV